MKRPVKRKYASRLRSQHALATRESVLAAAQRLFRGRGYAATSIARIAREAGVSPETIYAVFGNKRELLSQMVVAAIAGAGDETDIPFLERTWVAPMRGEPDRGKRLRYWINHTCETLERTSAIHAVIREATASEPALAGLKTEQRQFRHSMQRKLMQLIGDSGRRWLRLGIEQAAETFSILASPELHHLLRVELGWSKHRYQVWLADTLETLLRASGDTKD